MESHQAGVKNIFQMGLILKGCENKAKCMVNVCKYFRTAITMLEIYLMIQFKEVVSYSLKSHNALMKEHEKTVNKKDSESKLDLTAQDFQDSS